MANAYCAASPEPAALRERPERRCPIGRTARLVGKRDPQYRQRPEANLAFPRQRRARPAHLRCPLWIIEALRLTSLTVDSVAEGHAMPNIDNIPSEIANAIFQPVVVGRSAMALTASVIDLKPRS